MSAWSEIDRLKAESMKFADRPVHRNPKMSADRARTLRNEQRIANGRHPLNNRPLGAPIGVYTCADCAHLRKKETPARAVHFKCALYGDTNGPGTDLRKKWPACDLFKPENGR